VQRVQLRENIFERNTECKSEILGFRDCIGAELSICIIPPIIYNFLRPWTYLIWRTM
jgi:hypothetical protein